MAKVDSTLKQLNRASKLVNRAFHRNGPKSYKKGEGALLKVLHVDGGELSSRKLVDILAWDRPTLKDVVKKAERHGYVEIRESEEKKTYNVVLTPEGDAIAEKRCVAQDEIANAILEALSEDEQAQLDALTEKIIVRCKELGAHGKRHVVRKCRKKHGHKHCHKN